MGVGEARDAHSTDAQAAVSRVCIHPRASLQADDTSRRPRFDCASRLCWFSRAAIVTISVPTNENIVIGMPAIDRIVTLLKACCQTRVTTVHVILQSIFLLSGLRSYELRFSRMATRRVGTLLPAWRHVSCRHKTARSRKYPTAINNKCDALLVDDDILRDRGPWRANDGVKANRRAPGYLRSAAFAESASRWRGCMRGRRVDSLRRRLAADAGRACAGREESDRTSLRNVSRSATMREACGSRRVRRSRERGSRKAASAGVVEYALACRLDSVDSQRQCVSAKSGCLP